MTLFRILMIIFKTRYYYNHSINKDPYHLDSGYVSVSKKSLAYFLCCPECNTKHQPNNEALHKNNWTQAPMKCKECSITGYFAYRVFVQWKCNVCHNNLKTIKNMSNNEIVTYSKWWDVGDVNNFLHTKWSNISVDMKKYGPMYGNKKCDKCGISNVGHGAYIPELISNNRFEEPSYFSNETKDWFKMFVIIMIISFILYLLLLWDPYI